MIMLHKFVCFTIEMFIDHGVSTVKQKETTTISHAKQMVKVR